MKLSTALAAVTLTIGCAAEDKKLPPCIWKEREFNRTHDRLLLRSEVNCGTARLDKYQGPCFQVIHTDHWNIASASKCRYDGDKTSECRGYWDNQPFGIKLGVNYEFWFDGTHAYVESSSKRLTYDAKCIPEPNPDTGHHECNLTVLDTEWEIDWNMDWGF